MNETGNRSGFPRRNVIVMGASAGGLEPLQRTLAALPADLDAAIFVVLHIGATSYLAEILDRTSALLQEEEHEEQHRDGRACHDRQSEARRRCRS